MFLYQFCCVFYMVEKVNLAISDSEIKEIHKLDFLTTFEEKGLVRKIGFAKGKFVVFEFDGTGGTRGSHTEITIGDSFYEVLREQAKKGEYKSAKEFATRLLAPLSDYEKTPF